MLTGVWGRSLEISLNLKSPCIFQMTARACGLQRVQLSRGARHGRLLGILFWGEICGFEGEKSRPKGDPLLRSERIEK